MKSSDFPHVIDFPIRRRSVVYVFFCVTKNVEVPFYVGGTDRFDERMGDYFRAQFAAQTGFKVGEAIRYLTKTKRSAVKVGYRECQDRQDRRYIEREMIRSLHSRGFVLLNYRPGYRYRSANRVADRRRVHAFCDALISR